MRAPQKYVRAPASAPVFSKGARSFNVLMFSDRFVDFREVLLCFMKSYISIQERRIHFQCSEQFSNLQLGYFKKYLRLYPVNTMFFVSFVRFIEGFVDFRVVPLSFKKSYISIQERRIHFQCSE